MASEYLIVRLGIGDWVGDYTNVKASIATSVNWKMTFVGIVKSSCSSQVQGA